MIVLVPSECRKIVASRSSFSIPTSRITPEPPKISSERRVTSNAVSAAISLGAAAILGSNGSA